jgi:uncharacterized protein
MRPSKYNFWSQTPGGRDLLFNGRTGALVEVADAGEVESVIAALDGRANALTEEFARLGFLWEGDADTEIEAVLSRRDVEAASPRTLELTISPTYGCNFRCTYCYVDFVDARMRDEAEGRVLSFLRREIGQFAATNITWFGGEPLLTWRRVARMAAEIRDLGKAAGRPVEQFLTTNGYLLTPRVADALVEAGVQWIHVTIDGCGEGQDTRRVLLDGTGTYERVLRNLIRTLEDHPSVGGTLRMNLEPDSVDLAHTLLASIPEVLRARIQVHPTPVILEGVERDDSFHRRVAGVVTDALSLGYAYYDNDIPVARSFHCGAEGQQNFQIGPDGALHKCSPSGKPEVTVGIISPDGRPDLTVNDRVWRSVHQVADTCRACEFLCFCQGGCRLDRVRKRADPTCRDPFIAMPEHVMNRWLAANAGTIGAR